MTCKLNDEAALALEQLRSSMMNAHQSGLFQQMQGQGFVESDLIQKFSSGVNQCVLANLESIERLVPKKPESSRNDISKRLLEKPSLLSKTLLFVDAPLSMTPVFMMTERLCLEHVKKNGSNLFYVPDIYRTNEVCTEAVKQNGSAFKYVYDKDKTFEMCVLAAEKDMTSALLQMPESMKTKEFYRAALQVHIRAVNEVPVDVVQDFIDNDPDREWAARLMQERCNGSDGISKNPAMSQFDRIRG